MTNMVMVFRRSEGPRFEIWRADVSGSNIKTASCNTVRMAHGRCRLYVRSIANGRQETNASARIADLDDQRGHISEGQPVNVLASRNVRHLQLTSDNMEADGALVSYIIPTESHFTWRFRDQGNICTESRATRAQMDGFLGWGFGSFQIEFAKARTTILEVSLQDIVHDCCAWGRQPRPLVPILFKFDPGACYAHCQQRFRAGKYSSIGRWWNGACLGCFAVSRRSKMICQGKPIWVT